MEQNCVKCAHPRKCTKKTGGISVFSQIRKKLNISVLLIVGVMLIFSFSSLYGSFRMIIDNSYSERMARFAKQEVLNSSVTLSTVASSIDAMTEQTGFEAAAVSYDSYFLNRIRSAIQYYPYYDSFVMFADGKTMYYFNTPYREITRDNALLADVCAALGDAERGWSVFDGRLIYIRKYTVADKTAYAIFGIDTETVAADYASDSAFAANNCVYIAAKNGNSLLLRGSGKQDFAQISSQHSGKGKINSPVYVEEIDGTGITAYISSRTGYTDRRTVWAISMCILAAALIMLACYFTVNRLGREIECQLDRIHNEMQNY